MAAKKPPTTNERAHYQDLRQSFKKIEDYTDEDLDIVIKVLGYDEPNIFVFLNFVDCYFERRRRRRAAENSR